MQTRCPYCRTEFAVTLPQIKAHGGQVRCGVCNRIFNAEMAMVPQNLSRLPEEMLTEALAPKEKKPLRARLPARTPPPLQKPPAPYAAIFAPELATSAAVEEESVWWIWTLAVCIAAALLFVQVVIYFRSEIAVINAADQPYLRALCRPFGCQIGLPKKPEQLFVESSEVYPDNGRLALFATLKNRGDITVEYPHIELTLNDINNHLLIRRVITPHDYLPNQVQASAGLAARGEINLSLALNAPGYDIRGYRIYIFYP